MQKSVLAIFSIVAVFLVSFPLLAQETGQSNSKKYSFFDQESPERKQFALSQNGRVNQRLKNSPNREKLAAFFKSKFEAERSILRRPLADGEVSLIDRGLNKPQELVFKNKQGEATVIFSTFEFAKNNRLRFAGGRVFSPKRTKMLLSFSLDGSRDDVVFYVFDLTQKKTIVRHAACVCRPTEFFWNSESELLFADKAENVKVVKKMTFDGDSFSAAEVYPGFMVSSANPSVMVLAHKSEKRSVLLSMWKDPIELADVELHAYEFSDISENSVFFTSADFVEGVNVTELYRVDSNTGKFSLAKKFTGIVKIVGVSDKGVVYSEREGFGTSANFYSFEKQSTITLALPHYVSLFKAMSMEDPKVFTLSLTSDLNDEKEVDWNIETNVANIGENFEKEMLESADLALDVKFVKVVSFDGTEIPVKIVSKRGLPLEDRPAFFLDVYGGFASSATFNPYVDRWGLEFVRRGGILVAPALRGGDEFGEAWHRAAMREKKPNTFADLAATARYLIKNGISSREKIVISGGSNGGLTVAATGLIYPQYFGLVIAQNGVLDLLAKDNLDARYRGWRGEYGDANKPEDAAYLKEFSPLELVEKAANGPAFLIVNGRKDTRVNPAHSIKFAKAAEDLRAAGKYLDVELVSLNNAGHSSSAPDSDYIGIRAMVIEWSRIYDALNMNF